MSGASLYLEWGGDFGLNQNGGLQLASGWDYTRQFILRELNTNSQQVLPNGITTTPDYLFDILYGLGLPSEVDQSFTQAYLQKLVQRINQAVLKSPDVNPQATPRVKFFQTDPETLIVLVTVLLLNGEPGQIAFSVN